MKNVKENMNNNRRQDGKLASSSVISIVLIGFGLVIVLAAAWSLVNTYVTKAEVNEQLKIAQLEYQQAVERNREAQQQLQLVNDPEYIAQIARRDYYYSKPGEIIFNFEEDLTHKTQQENNN